MILNKQLQVLIESSLAQGRDYEDIRNILLKQGFKDDDITDLFSQYRGGDFATENVVQTEEKVEENKTPQTISPELKTTNAKDELLTQTSKTEINLSQKQQAQNIVDKSAEGYEESLVKYPDEQKHLEEYSKINENNSQKVINIGLSGMPEIQNVLAEESAKKSEKSAAPLVITLLTLLVLISGFFYWLLVLKDGGAAILKDKAGITNTSTTTPDTVATPTPPEIPGSRDPFTGELFEVE